MYKSEIGLGHSQVKYFYQIYPKISNVCSLVFKVVILVNFVQITQNVLFLKPTLYRTLKLCCLHKSDIVNVYENVCTVYAME